MSDQTSAPPKFAVGQRVFAVRMERMKYNPESPIAIGTIKAEAMPFGAHHRRYTLSNTEPTLVFLEQEIHATAADAIAAVFSTINAERFSLSAVEKHAVAYIAANT